MGCFLKEYSGRGFSSFRFSDLRCSLSLFSHVVLASHGGNCSQVRESEDPLSIPGFLTLSVEPLNSDGSIHMSSPFTFYLHLFIYLGFGDATPGDAQRLLQFQLGGGSFIHSVTPWDLSTLRVDRCQKGDFLTLGLGWRAEVQLEGLDQGQSDSTIV